MKTYLLIALSCMFFTGCSKTGFLDARPDPSQVVPETLADYQAILDNDVNMNGEGYGIVPALGETGADDYYVTSDIYHSYLQLLYQRAYIWEKDVFESEQIYDWNIPYQGIYTANVVLDGLRTLTINADQQTAYNKAEGSALFYRAHLFYQLAQIFALPYTTNSADTLPGLPLRLTSSLTETLKRSTLGQTYAQIISDIKTATSLLPALPSYATQPCKAACYGLLARVFLTMHDYRSALAYSDSCLRIKSDLMDYNLVDTSTDYPFQAMNQEDIFHCEMIRGPDLIPVNPNYAFADSTLYHSYDANDLRKAIFFKPRDNGYYFSGSYSGYYGMYAGIATDEVYLIQAECNARAGKPAAALNDLNTLLLKRYKKGSFVNYTVGNTTDVLRLILTERRKELCFRGLRWIDLRRLNSEGAGIELFRKVDDALYTLGANDSRYVYPIPQPVINANPLIEQNIR